MGRIAGDSDSYEFRLVRLSDQLDEEGIPETWVATPHGFAVPSVSAILNVLGKNANAMSHWGYNLGIEGMLTLAQVEGDLSALSVDEAKERLKQAKFAPNTVRDIRGEEGSNAHAAAEFLGRGYIPTEMADGKLFFERNGQFGSVNLDGYVRAVLAFYEKEMPGWVVLGVEEPVWCLCPDCTFCGTLDLARQQGITNGPIEIVDFKTHKPQVQKQTDHTGPGYVTDIFQGRAYRKGWQERFGQEVVQQRVVCLDVKGRYFMDTREVSLDAWQRVCGLYGQMKEVENFYGR